MWLPPLQKQLARARGEMDESYAKAFPFDKVVDGMLDPEMIEDTAKIVSAAAKDKVQVNLIVNNHAGGDAPLIARKIINRLHNFAV